jgi:hypothetical protein
VMVGHLNNVFTFRNRQTFYKERHNNREARVNFSADGRCVSGAKTDGKRVTHFGRTAKTLCYYCKQSVI